MDKPECVLFKKVWLTMRRSILLSAMPGKEMQWCRYSVRMWICLHRTNVASCREHNLVMTPSALGAVFCFIAPPSLLNDILFCFPVPAAPHFDCATYPSLATP